MKIRKQQDIAPINLMPGDSITLSYAQEGEDSRELVTETFNETRTIDRVAIVELETDELWTLGMEQGIAGVFGKQLIEP